MPKNKGKGGKNRRRGKNENESEKRELVFKEDGQEYAQVIKMLGNGRLEAMCFDGVKRLCHIRGKLRKKVWINTSDIILVGLRDYQDNKADVILKYNADEARSLKAYGELPEHGVYLLCLQLKSMIQIHLVLEMMMKSSLMILEMMTKTLMISELNSEFVRIILQF
ncbi:eukaryotic translation initiation factor 1A, X-chromosomal-like isoform X1 [Meles meles]|uniref:eukaryotic translation initiation factor 1A, X-chromosomal-like isoform X1 n=1 Tax=Meles meles TaxID=9662 RepID=UPI001E698C04|nr:eukaryotic translation initiation factor 1A, X-chromosomal-like isoform X1 [Meles meles]